MCYDIVSNKQMDDLVVLPGDLTDKIVAIAVNYLPDGRLLHTRGDYFEVLDDQGNVISTIIHKNNSFSPKEIVNKIDSVKKEFQTVIKPLSDDLYTKLKVHS